MVRSFFSYTFQGGKKALLDIRISDHGYSGVILSSPYVHVVV